MSVAVKSKAGRHVSSNYSSKSSSSSKRSASANGVLNRIHEAETRSHRPRSHAGSLVLANHHDNRPLEEINAEIAALEAEARANKFDRRAEITALEAQARAYNLERKAEHERALAMNLREAPRHEFYEERRLVRRSLDDEIVIGRPRSPPRSPPRNVVRVQKDRRGRMALVKSTY